MRQHSRRPRSVDPRAQAAPALEPLEPRLLLDATFPGLVTIAPADAPSLPAGMDAFSPGVDDLAQPAAGAPTIAEWTRTAGADDSLVITGWQLSNFTDTDAGKDTRFVVYGQTAAGDGVWADALIQRLDGDVAVITLPDNLPTGSDYLLWAINDEGASEPVVVNRAESWWVGPDQASAGDVVSIYGRNMSQDGGTAASYVYVQPDGGAGQWAQVVAANPYRVDFVVPAGLANGDYQVWVHNGDGGQYGWSAPLTLTVRDPLADTGVRFDITSYGAIANDGLDDTAAIQSALNAAAASPGSSVYLPAGQFVLSSQITLKSNVHWEGAGMDATTLLAAAGFSGSYMFYAKDPVVSNITFRDLTIDRNKSGSVASISGDDITFTRVRLDGQGGSPLGGGGSRLTVTDSIVIGGSNFLNFSMVIDGVDFYGTDNAGYIVMSWSQAPLSITNCTVQDLNAAESDGYWQGRFFVSQQKGSYNYGAYIAQCTTIDASPPGGGNTGEQILFEDGDTHWVGTPDAVSGNTVTFLDMDMLAESFMQVVVIDGKGVGQYRRVESYDLATHTITLRDPWRVVPDQTSTLAVVHLADRAIIYDNYLDAKAEAYTSETHYATTGVMTYLGGVDVIVADNTFHELRSGVSLWSVSDDLPLPQFNNLYINNTFDHVRWAIQIIANSPDVGINDLGNVFRNNTIDVALVQAIGISTGTSPTHAGAWVVGTVFEHNVVTNTPIAFAVTGQTGAVIDTVLYDNSFSRGTAALGGSVGLEFNEGMAPALRENTFSAFADTYLGELPGAVLEAPYRVLLAYGTLAGPAVEVDLPVWNAGTSQLNWSLAESVPWLSVSPTSGFVANQGGTAHLTVTCDPALLGAGVYGDSGTITLYGGGKVLRITVEFTVGPVVEIEAVTPTATEQGTSPASFRVTRSGQGTSPDEPVTVYYSVSGSATAGSDYAALSGSVVIPAGATSAVVTLNPTDDSAVEDDETVVLTLQPNAAYALGSAVEATATIVDDEPRVGVIASDPWASETGDAGELSFYRLNGTSGALTVHFTVAGSGSEGSDYSTLPRTVVIPDGAASVTLAISVLNDSFVEGAESVVVAIAADAAYSIAPADSQATVLILDDDLPAVSIAATDASAAEAGADTATFTVARTGSTAEALTVQYTVAGTAVGGSDYAILSGTVVIPAGSASAPIVLTPIDDDLIENAETVELTVVEDIYSYRAGSPASATATIASDDVPVITIVATDAYADEAHLDTGEFTVTRSGNGLLTDSALTVYYSVSGTATTGSDYATLPGTVVIPAGATQAVIHLGPKQDAVADDGETVIVQITDAAGYDPAAPSAAQVTLRDDLPLVTIAATDTQADEQGQQTAAFTFTRTDTAGDLVVHYTVGGSADQADFTTPLTGTITIPDGSAVAVLTLTPADDSLWEYTEELTLTLAESPAYRVVDYAIPTDYADLALWLDAANLDGSYNNTVAAGQYVSQWADLSGQGNTVTNTTSGTDDNPMFLGDGFGATDMPYLNFDGNDGLSKPNLDHSDFTGLSFLVVFRRNAYNTFGVSLLASENGGYGVGSDRGWGGAPDGGYSDGFVRAYPAAESTNSTPVFYSCGQDLVLSSTFSYGTDQTGTMRILQEDGTLAGTWSAVRTGDFAYTGTSHLGIGCQPYWWSASTYYRGAIQADIAEIVYFGRELTATELDSLETYLNYKYHGYVGDVSATITLTDNEPIVRLDVTDASASESPADNATFTVTRDGTAGDLTVYYSVTGTATNGEDYQTLSGQVVIPDGQAMASIVVQPINDAWPENVETVRLTLQQHETYGMVGSALPQSFAGLTMWLDAGNVDGMNNQTLSQGQAVDYWADLSGSGNPVLAANTASSTQPTLRNGEINGLPVLRFDGIDDGLTRDGFDFSGYEGLSILTVVYSQETDSSRHLIGVGGGGWGDRWALSATSTGWSFFTMGGSVSTAVSGRNSDLLLSAGYTFGTGTAIGISQIQPGGTEYSYSAAATYDLDSTIHLGIGNQPMWWSSANYTGCLEADVAEVLVFNRELTSYEFDLLQEYLAVKYGLVGGRTAAASITSEDVDTTAPTVVGVEVNGSVGRSVSDVDPSARGVQTVTVRFDEPVFFDGSAVSVNEVAFAGQMEQLGAAVTPLSVSGSRTDAMTLTFAEGAVRNTWIKIVLSSAGIGDYIANALDGEPAAGGSGREYLYDSSVDLPTGDGVAGGDASFYLGSLVCDFSGDGQLDAADGPAYAAAYAAGSADADFRGRGFASAGGDGLLTPADVDGFAAAWQAGSLAGTAIGQLPEPPAIVFDGELFRIIVSSEPVGTEENLLALTLTMVAKDGQSANGFDGVISGLLHQDQAPFRTTYTPTPTDAWWTNNEYDSPSELDSYFMLGGSGIVPVVNPTEDVWSLPSDETSPYEVWGHACGFGTEMSGTFALANYAAETWSFAQIVAPVGSTLDLNFWALGRYPGPYGLGTEELVDVSFVVG